MTTAKVKWDDARFKAVLAKGVADGLREVGIHLQTKITNSFGNAGRHESSQPGQPPNSRRAGSAGLKGSIGYQMIGKTRVRVGTNLEYARLLEFGARITPKKAKALTIPISVKAKRWSEQGLSPSTKSEKPIPIANKLFMVKRKGQAPLLCQSVGGKRARVIVHYVLAGSTTILPRPFLRPAITNGKDKMQSVFTRKSRESIRQRLGAA